VPASKEFELEAIAIEAVIEKPNVEIIPKRRKPDLEEMRFIDRSFDHELKSVPKKLLILDEEMDRVHKVEGIKKVKTKRR